MTDPLIEEEIRRMVAVTQRQLGLSDWEIRVHIGEVGDDNEPGKRLAGASISNPEYKSGDVYFDPDQIAFEHAELAKLVRHEMLHLVVSPIVALADLWAGGDPARERFVVYVHEQTVTHLERMPLWEDAT